MKYTGPVRVISNTDIANIKEHINYGRVQIGKQKDFTGPDIKSHYKNTRLPDGSIVETWYSYNNHTIKVTVPEAPPIESPLYIPGIVMAPMDDVGKWGYGSPFTATTGQLGTACPTYDIVKFGSSLLRINYLPGTTDYDHSEIIRPWKQPTIDPRSAEHPYLCNRFAFIKTNVDGKYVGNVTFSDINTFGYSGTQFPGLFVPDLPSFFTEGRLNLDYTDSSKDRNDGYYILERFRQASTPAIFFTGIPKVKYDGYAYKYLQKTESTINKDIIFFCKLTGSGTPDTGVNVTFYFQKYNVTDFGKYLENALITSPDREILASLTVEDIGCYFDIYADPERMKGSHYYQAIGGTTNQFYICHSKPRFSDNRRYDNAMGAVWKTYEISSDFESISNINTLEYLSIPGDFTYDSLANFYQHFDLTVDDVIERIVAVGNTYKGNYRQITIGYSNISFSYHIDDADGFGGDPGVATRSYSITKNYSIPDGSGGTLTLNLTDSGESAVINTSPSTITGSSIQWIECNFHTDTYVYAIVEYTGEIAGSTITIEGSIEFYRNGSLFYTYTTASPIVVNPYSTMQLPWFGVSNYNSTRRLPITLFRYFLGDLQGDLQSAATGTAYFDTPFLDIFTWWQNESEYDETYNYTNWYAYTIDCKTVVDPGADAANPNIVTILAMKHPLEGSMDTQPISYYSWWNNELLDGKSIEEMLLIDSKTNPRITNFGVI